MPITLNGTTGIQNVLGSASAPADTNTTTPTTGIYYPSATTWGVSTAGTNALYIDASQNVGIGTTTPAYTLDVRKNQSNIAYLQYSDGTYNPRLVVTGSSSGITLNADYSTGANAMIFQSGGSEVMRYTSSGNLLVGTTSTFGKLSTLVSNGGVAWGSTNTSGTGLYYAAIFYNNGTSLSGCGSIVVSGTSTAYNVTSDYRLKENVTPMSTGLATVAALKPVNYDWISTKEQGEGFIAHELQAIIPNAVTGEKDAVNEDGSIKPQGVDYSKIVVHLVAAIQELKAEFDAYKAAHP